MKIARLAAWADTWRGLVCLFALGLVIRLVLARISDGLWFDVTLFRVWSDRLVRDGLAAVYSPTPEYVVDYPPGYLYVLLALGKASHALLGSSPPVSLLKVPAILADMGVALLSMRLATRVVNAQTTRRVPVRALAAAAILFNPALMLVSSVWGQVDSVLALLVLAAICVIDGPASIAREAGAVALLAVAAATKPQVVYALPIFGALLIWRHSSDAWRPLLVRVVVVVGIASGIVYAMFIPFGLGPPEILAFYRNAGSLYPFTSLWAFNVWGAVAFYRHDVGPEAVRIAGVAAFQIGLAMFAVMTAAVVVQCWRALTSGIETEAVVLLGAAAMTCAGFALLTRMHERYLYLAVAALAPFVGHRRLRWALAILSVCFLMNVHFVYVFYSQHGSPPGGAWTIQPIYDAIFGRSANALQLKVLSTATTAVCLAVAAFGWSWLDGRAAHRGKVLTTGRNIMRQASLT